MPVMRCRTCAMFCLAVLIAAAASMVSAQKADAPRVVLLDRIVTVVNDEVITRGDLDERVKVAVGQMRSQGTSPPPTEVLEKQVLERLIYNKVQLQFAKETGLRIDDNALNSAINRIAR